MEAQSITPCKPEDIINLASEIRVRLDGEEKALRGYVDNIKNAEETTAHFNKGECIAQAMLALRHIEDARMRVGKVIQYADGGLSVYDKAK